MGPLEQCLRSSKSKSHSVELVPDCVSRGKKSRRRLRKVALHTFLRKLLKDALQNDEAVNAENKGTRDPQSDAGQEQPCTPLRARRLVAAGVGSPSNSARYFFLPSVSLGEQEDVILYTFLSKPVIYPTDVHRLRTTTHSVGS